MKIECWEDIENIRLNSKGNFFDIIRKRIYHHYEHCKKCGDQFFGYTDNVKNNEYCSRRCSNIGRKHTDETKKKMSEKAKLRTGEKNSFYGKRHSEEYKKRMSENKKGKGCGRDNGNWRGGYRVKGIPTYDTYSHQLEWIEEVRRNEQDPNVLEVKCFKCGEWYVPSYNSVINRLQVLKNNYRGYQRFYCSDQCRNNCSIYGKRPETLIREDAIRAGRLSWLELGREVQPELRQMVLERDGHKCVKCNNTNNLQCHHIMPVAIEPLLSADIDNCIMLCIECHKEAHTKDGCRYGQLYMKEC